MIKPTATNKTKELAGFFISALLIFVLGIILRINLVIVLFLLAETIYIKYLYLNLSRTAYRMLNLSFLFVIIFVVSYIFVRQNWPIYLLPFSSISMLAAMLFNELTISFLLTMSAAFAVASISGNQLNLAILFLVSGTISIILVFGARRRLTILRSGLIVGAIQALTLFLTQRFYVSHISDYALLLLNGIGCGIIVIGTLSIFEYLFKTITNVSLLELADFSQPILHRMMLEAPGTFHHSLMVGNLSEAACDAIGANSLLARIGAYYHDIGKLEKPEYFSENQEMESSKHDNLTPTMSKMVIMNHVKEGVELAKRYRLNPTLINFILQHHGNSLVYYFYRRALESIEEDEANIEEGFRYPGPKPDTKETAIVLLADSTEAATRAIKESSPGKIEEVVHKVINNKFIDGQLDECDLTLKDLEKIASVFIRILSAIYHSRVTYPDGSSADNHKKSPKENSRLSEKDKKSNS